MNCCLLGLRISHSYGSALDLQKSLIQNQFMMYALRICNSLSFSDFPT